VVPDNYNSKFLFDQVIETLEEDLASFWSQRAAGCC
jgi:hypothetical protein